MIPKDPVILLSFVNTKLRDEYPSLAELCAALGADRAALEAALAALDYHYDSRQNQFICADCESKSRMKGKRQRQGEKEEDKGRRTWQAAPHPRS